LLERRAHTAQLRTSLTSAAQPAGVQLEAAQRLEVWQAGAPRSEQRQRSWRRRPPRHALEHRPGLVAGRPAMNAEIAWSAAARWSAVLAGLVNAITCCASCCWTSGGASWAGTAGSAARARRRSSADVARQRGVEPAGVVGDAGNLDTLLTKRRGQE